MLALLACRGTQRAGARRAIGATRSAGGRRLEAEPRGIDLIGLLRTVHPSITVEQALHNFDVLENDAEGRDTGEPGVGYATWKKTGHPFSKTWDPWDDGSGGKNGKGKSRDNGDDDAMLV